MFNSNPNPLASMNESLNEKADVKRRVDAQSGLLGTLKRHKEIAESRASQAKVN